MTRCIGLDDGKIPVKGVDRLPDFSGEKITRRKVPGDAQGLKKIFCRAGIYSGRGSARRLGYLLNGAGGDPRCGNIVEPAEKEKKQSEHKERSLDRKKSSHFLPPWLHLLFPRTLRRKAELVRLLHLLHVAERSGYQPLCPFRNDPGRKAQA